MGNAAEIVGKVQGDLSIKVYQAMDFGTNIGEMHCRLTSKMFHPLIRSHLTDFSAVEAVVDATHRYKEIFYDSRD